jgi:SAM-dependent methyltransferase
MIGDRSGWGDGYITDIAYVPGYYRHQSPLHLNLACLLGGVAGVAIGPETPLSYLELGCGQGFGTLVLAASNPRWQVIGIDFNPAHIAAARELADEAGIINARFLEADLATLADEDAASEIPQADVVSLHGLWSWVADGVRAGIVDLLAKKLRPGGIAHVSYNALPAWQGALGMQRLLREAGRRVSARSDRQAAAGLETLRALIDAKAVQVSGNPFVENVIQHADRLNLAYAAHEYMNAAWRPCFHADVVAAFAEAKLDWVAAAHLLENFTPLMLGDEARAVAAQFDDPIMRELVKDLCLTRGLRQDVFVRGARRLTPQQRDDALGEITLALDCAPDKFVWEFDVPSGRARIERPFFQPIVEALGDGPRSVRELLALPGLPRRDNPGEVVGMLAGSEQALPVFGRAASTGGGPAAQLIAAAARRFVRVDNLGTGMGLPSSGTGSPVPGPMLDLFVAARLQQEGPPDSAGWAADLLAGESAAEQQRLGELIERTLSERVPRWRALGVLPPAAG